MRTGTFSSSSTFSSHDPSLRRKKNPKQNKTNNVSATHDLFFMSSLGVGSMAQMLVSSQREPIWRGDTSAERWLLIPLDSPPGFLTNSTLIGSLHCKKKCCFCSCVTQACRASAEDAAFITLVVSPNSAAPFAGSPKALWQIWQQSDWKSALIFAFQVRITVSKDVVRL